MSLGIDHRRGARLLRLAPACIVALLWFADALAAGAQPDPPDSEIVSGSASYRQRVAMPAEAVLTVRVEEVSRADAPATLLAETHEAFGPRQVPIPFSLEVRRSAIDSRLSYAVRATITVADVPQFSSTRSYPILTRGASNRVELWLEPVTPAASDEPGPGAFLGSLPATFTGVTPCADCPGVALSLTLRADGLYRLRRAYLGRPDEPAAEIGRWTVAAGGHQIAVGRGEAAHRFTVVNGDTLRQLDRFGHRVTSSGNLDLRRTAPLDAITETARWRGEFWLFADSPTFTDCASGLRWPVATAGDYQALDRRFHHDQGAMRAPLIVTLEGRLEMGAAAEGPPREHMLVEHLGNVEPGANCASAVAKGASRNSRQAVKGARP